MNCFVRQCAVEDMLNAIAHGDIGLWAMPLVNALESKGNGYAIEWMIAYLRHRLDGLLVENRAVKEEWLQGLESLRRTSFDYMEFLRCARKIWYHIERDAVQTSIAKLYEATAGHVNGDCAGYKKALAMAISAMVMDHAGHISQQKLQDLIEWFNGYGK